MWIFLEEKLFQVGQKAKYWYKIFLLKLFLQFEYKKTA